MDYSFIETYFPEKPVFTSYRDLLGGWLRLTDILCLVLLSSRTTEEEAPVAQLQQIYDWLLEAGNAYLDEAGGMSLWNMIYADIFSLDELMALLLATARECDSKYDAMFDKLNGAGSSGMATVKVAQEMAALLTASKDTTPSHLFDEHSFLNTYVLEHEVKSGKSRLQRLLKIRKYALEALQDGARDYASMRLFAQILPPVNSQETVLREKELERLSGFLTANGTRVISLLGAEGSGRRYLLSRATSRTGNYVLHIRLEVFLTMDNRRLDEYLDELAFKYYLYGDYIYITAEDFERFDTDRLQLVFSRILTTGAKIITGSLKAPSKVYLGEDSIRIKMERIPRIAQMTLWEELAKRMGMVFDKALSLKEIVSKYDLNPGSIAAVLRIVAMNAKEDKKGNLVVTQKQIEDEINIQSDVAFGTLATKIDNPFTKDDIYLNDVAAEQLERVLERIRYRSVVNESFGFGRNLPYGRGVSVVLYGPPGTGKTMLASVIANELNLPLYRVDLSQLSSKYIGETEKNVADLFAAASNSNGILFFDEADALFARRTDVSGSNDRYANAETAYLLQQVEGYDGLSILATNAMQNFDVAFKRRMTFLISIEKPNEEERIRLWNEIFPKDTPLDKNIDFKILAQKAELTGSAIKAAALDAAYRAAVRGDQVTMNDLIDAVEVQCRRNGMIGVGSSIRFGG